MTCLQELFFRPVSSYALLQTHFFRRILPDASKLQIKFLCSWTCSIRIFMNSTLIMDPVHLNKLFSISNWWFLIPCYYQNLRGDFEKHPLFQQYERWRCRRNSGTEMHVVELGETRWRRQFNGHLGEKNYIVVFLIWERSDYRRMQMWEKREIELKAEPTRVCHLHVIHTSFLKLSGCFLLRDIAFP